MSGKEKRERRERMDSCAPGTRNDQSASRRPHSQPAYNKLNKKEKKDHRKDGTNSSAFNGVGECW